MVNKLFLIRAFRSFKAYEIVNNLTFIFIGILCVLGLILFFE